MNKSTKHTGPRNRLAKPLPDQWRQLLIDHGIPKRKYAAVLRATLVDGRVIEDLIVEQGWIVSLSKRGLAGIFEERIDFDPRDLIEVEIKQVV